MWNGELIRETTRQKNDGVARNMESAHRTALAKGEVGIREKKKAPTLAEFLERDFLPYVETKHANNPGTVAYYKDGAKMLDSSDLASLRLDEVNDQHAQRFTGATLKAVSLPNQLRTPHASPRSERGVPVGHSGTSCQGHPC